MYVSSVCWTFESFQYELTFVEHSSIFFFSGSTMECSCTYVCVWLVPSIYTHNNTSHLTYTFVLSPCMHSSVCLWLYTSIFLNIWMLMLWGLTARTMPGRPHSVLSSLWLCRRPSASRLRSRTSTPTTLGFMGFGYFLMAALITVSQG